MTLPRRGGHRPGRVALPRSRGPTRSLIEHGTGKSQPTLFILRKLAISLGVSADLLLFDIDERGPSEDLRLQFEATQRLDPDERQVIKTVIESILIKHEAKRWAATG